MQKAVGGSVPLNITRCNRIYWGVINQHRIPTRLFKWLYGGCAKADVFQEFADRMWQRDFGAFSFCFICVLFLFFLEWWRLEHIVLRLVELACRRDPVLTERCFYFSFRISFRCFLPVGQNGQRGGKLKKSVIADGYRVEFTSAVVLSSPALSPLFCHRLLKDWYLFNCFTFSLTIVCHKFT